MPAFTSGARITQASDIADGIITNAHVSTTAAIAYSKLNLATSIVNADIAGAAAIAYSKLSLAASIVNADIATAAAIVPSKLNTLKASTTLGAAGASISVTGLDLATDKAYRIECVVSSDGTGGGRIDMEVNTDTTATNYYNELVTSQGATLNSAVANNAQIAQPASVVNEVCNIVIFMSLDQDSKPRAIIQSSQGDAGTVDEQYVSAWSHNSTTNVTSIQLKRTTGNFVSGGKVSVFTVPT